jgi:hypothetical protein
MSLEEIEENYYRFEIKCRKSTESLDEAQKKLDHLYSKKKKSKIDIAEALVVYRERKREKEEADDELKGYKQRLKCELDFMWEFYLDLCKENKFMEVDLFQINKVSFKFICIDQI